MEYSNPLTLAGLTFAVLTFTGLTFVVLTFACFEIEKAEQFNIPTTFLKEKSFTYALATFARKV